MNSPRDALGRAVYALRLIVAAHEAGGSVDDMIILARAAVLEAEKWDERRAVPTSGLLRTHQAQICNICGTPIGQDESHLDHVIALANGGTNDPDNLRVTHASCNVRKGAA